MFTDDEVTQNSDETPPNGLTGFVHHPSGVELADPPPGTDVYDGPEPPPEALIGRRSGTLPTLVSRRSSVNLMSVLQRSKQVPISPP